MRITSGIVLPESILGQPWFQTFTLFVAFNTIVYLGLTMSKLVPWPAQIHPDRVRAILPSVHNKDTTMKDIPRSEINDPQGEFVRRRMLTAAGSIPLALSLVAGIAIVILTLILVFVSSTIDVYQVAVYAVAIIMLIWAQIASHARVPARVIVWSWTVLMLALIILTSFYGIVNDNEIALLYGVMLFVLLPGMTISWPSGLIGGFVGLVVVAGAGIIINKLDSLQWSIAALGALAIGMVGLEVRRSSTDRILLEEMKCELLATTDPLTRSLTRSTMQVLAPSVIQAAAAAGQQVHLVMIDIAGMHGINADYGPQYGDAVIINTYEALRGAAASSDLVARWDGDCFVVLGVGPGSSADALERDVERDVAERGIALGKRPIEVRVSVTREAAVEASLDQLVHEAVVALPARPERESAG